MTRGRWIQAIAAVVAVCALLVGTTGVASGRTSATTGLRLVATTGRAPRVSVAPASAECPKFNRTVACVTDPVRYFTALRNGAPVGLVSYVVVHVFRLNVKSRHFSEHVSVKTLSLTGLAAGTEVTLTATCDSPCTSFGLAKGVMSPGGDIESDLPYYDETTTTDTDNSHYTVVGTLAEFGTASTDWFSPVDFRCDNLLKSQGAGCVFPDFTPTISSMSELPQIAANIRHVQTHGTVHIGRSGTGGRPLHRLINAALQRRNHDLVCPRKTPPKHKGKSCDEYPFQSSYEGGHSLPAADRGIAWVAIPEQNSQGGRLNAFYLANRVLDRDAYWVEV